MCILIPDSLVSTASCQFYLGQIQTAIRAGYPKVVVDLHRVNSLSALGLAWLVRAYKLCQTAGIEFQVTGVVHEQVVILLQLTRLFVFLPMDGNRQNLFVH